MTPKHEVFAGALVHEKQESCCGTFFEPPRTRRVRALVAPSRCCSRAFRHNTHCTQAVRRIKSTKASSLCGAGRPPPERAFWVAYSVFEIASRSPALPHCPIAGELDLKALNAWLSDLLSEKSADLFRSKGIFAVEGSDDKYFF